MSSPQRGQLEWRPAQGRETKCYLQCAQQLLVLFCHYLIQNTYFLDNLLRINTIVNLENGRFLLIFGQENEVDQR